MTKRRPFAFRSGEPTNPMAWLGVAAYVRAKKFPRYFSSIPLDLTQACELRHAIELARQCEDQQKNPFWRATWRRVLLPMLLAEANKRGLDV
jgi:hypothetical protein